MPGLVCVRRSKGSGRYIFSFGNIVKKRGKVITPPTLIGIFPLVHFSNTQESRFLKPSRFSLMDKQNSKYVLLMNKEVQGG